MNLRIKSSRPYSTLWVYIEDIPLKADTTIGEELLSTVESLLNGLPTERGDRDFLEDIRQYHKSIIDQVTDDDLWAWRRVETVAFGPQPNHGKVEGFYPWRVFETAFRLVPHGATQRERAGYALAVTYFEFMRKRVLKRTQK